MILKRLTLERYGIYRNRVDFDLSPRMRHDKHCPIVLFGGKNGAGKTTILTALRLALHGVLALPKGSGRAGYGQFLRERINRASGATAIAPTLIELEFEYALSGHRHDYVVQRSWYDHDGNIREHLEVRKDGSLLKDVDRDHWSEFIRDLVPPGLLELFFFDGEKIQDLAEDDADGTHFKEALTALLNLDLIDSLRADLAIYARRERSEQGTADLQRDLEKLRREKEEGVARGEGLRQRLAQNRTRSDQLESKRRQLDRQLTRKGGDWGASRPTLQIQKEELGAKLKALEERVRELCHGALPLALVSALSRRYRDRVHEEREGCVKRLVRKEVAGVLNHLDSPEALKELGAALTIPREGKATWIRFLKDLAKSLSDSTPQGTQTPPPIHDLSSGQEIDLVTQLDLAQGPMVREIGVLSQDLESTLRALKEAEVAIAKAPSEDVLAQLLEELRVVNEEQGARAQEARHLDEELNGADRLVGDIDRRMQGLVEQVEVNEGLQARLSLTERASKALIEFRQVLAKNRVRHLERLATESFQRLARKKCLVHEIRISPETFEVSLHNVNGQMVPKRDLSAGEKQIYAVSLLWALGKVSGRPLPIVIDTPLGRLDSDHRKTLIYDYFPIASHQVIILSTDTEVDQHLAEALKPYTARTYRLDFSTQEQATKVESGYFWNAVSVQE